MARSVRPLISVQWLVAQPALGLVVAAGAPALDRTITFAHSIDLADPGPWLRGGELLLTTGLLLPPDAEDQKRYLREVIDAGAAAVGFGVGLSHPDTPRALIEEADRLGIPLLEIPRSTPFVAVVRAVTTRLAEAQYHGVVRASRVLPRMTRAALRQGPAAVLRELSVALGGHVVIFDEDHTVTLSSPTNPGPGSVELPAADELAKIALRRAQSSVYVTSHGVVNVQVIRAGQRVHGYLALTTPHGLDPTDHLLVGHAVSLIALEQEKPLRAREELARVNEVILEMMLDGSLNGERAVVRLEQAGLPVRAGLSVLVLRGGAPGHLLAAVDDVLLPLRLPRACLSRGHDVVVVLPASPNGLAAQVTRLAAKRCTSVMVHAGVATARQNDLLEAVHRASTAAASAQSRGRELVDAASMAGHALMSDPASRAVLSQLAHSLLGPLVEHDRSAGSNMVMTLRIFLDHNGHIETAADTLTIHRHTLRARLERIREILAVDLDSAHVRAELLLALSSGVAGGATEAGWKPKIMPFKAEATLA